MKIIRPPKSPEPDVQVTSTENLFPEASQSEEELYSLVESVVPTWRDLQKLEADLAAARRELEIAFAEKYREELENVKLYKGVLSTIRAHIQSSIESLVHLTGQKTFLEDLVSVAVRTRPRIDDEDRLKVWARHFPDTLALPTKSDPRYAEIVKKIFEIDPSLLIVDEKAAAKKAVHYPDSGAVEEQYVTQISDEKFEKIFGSIELYKEIGRPPRED